MTTTPASSQQPTIGTAETSTQAFKTKRRSTKSTGQKKAPKQQKGAKAWWLADEGWAAETKTKTGRPKSSHLEDRFLRCWQAAGGPDLEREVAFDQEARGPEGRKWRADFCHRASRTLIEIDGGVFSGGRHTRGRGFAEDCEKHLAAWRHGWTVIRLCEPLIRLYVAEAIVARLKAGEAKEV